MLNKEFIDKVMNTNYDCDTERAEVRVFAKQIELRSNITGIYVKDNIIYLCNNSEPYTNSNYLTYTTLCEKLGEFPDDYKMGIKLYIDGFSEPYKILIDEMEIHLETITELTYNYVIYVY